MKDMFDLNGTKILLYSRSYLETCQAKRQTAPCIQELMEHFDCRKDGALLFRTIKRDLPSISISHRLGVHEVTDSCYQGKVATEGKRLWVHTVGLIAQSALPLRRTI